MSTFPVNTIPYFLASIATFVVGIRSTQNYRKLRSPLSRHFAVSGFLASAGLFLYSVPFMLGLSLEPMRVAVVLGRLCLDVVAYYQLYLIWYLTSLRQVPLRRLVVPAVVIGLVGFIPQLYHTLTSFVGVINNQATYSFVMFSLYLHMFALLIVLAAGIVLAQESFKQKEQRGRIRLFSVALLYIAASIADLYSALFLQGLNNSWVVYVGFVIASGGFLITTLFVLKRNKNAKITS